jgi:hypothetical protein
VGPDEVANFLKDYIRLAEDTEVPDIFMFWCGLSGLSCALGRRVWIDMGHYTIYPNTYIVLVSGSGKCKKSIAIEIIERLLRQLEPSPNIIAQKITPEALIEAIRVVTVNDKVIMRESCEGIIIADEFSTLLDRKSYDAGLGAMLITLFDCKETFEYRTKIRGSELLFNTCLGLLAGSTVDSVRKAIPIDAVGQGLTSRICFVYTDIPKNPILRTTYGEDKRKLQDDLVRHLQKVSTVGGPVKLTDEAWSLSEDIYNTFYRTSTFYDDPLMAGYASRRCTHLLKLAMLFSIAEDNSLMVQASHVRFANNLLIQSESDMSKVVKLIASSDVGVLAELVLMKVQARERVSRNEILKSLSHRVSSRELTEVLDTLIQSRQITSRTDGNTIYYTFIKGA